VQDGRQKEGFWDTFFIDINMNLPSLIKASEERYRKSLEFFFLKNWGDARLLSHGLDHHRRVWHYAKEILFAVNKSGIETNPDLPAKLIIASYTHDIGMSVDPGERHGSISSKLCRQFIDDNHLNELDFNEVMHAVAIHDKKEYDSSSQGKTLLSILSVADDLDAFGYIGIYRYLEIYLTRGIPAGKAVFLIKTNAESRYRNFLNFSSDVEGLAEIHETRYLILHGFLNGFISEIDNPAKRSEISGHHGISEMISDNMNNKLTEKEIHSRFSRDRNDRIINDFTSGYLRELKAFPE